MAVDVTLTIHPRDTEANPPGVRYSCAQFLDRDHRCVVVRIEGELDALAQHRFCQALDNAVHSDCGAVVVDLRATLFLSLRAAAALGEVQAPAALRGIDVRVVTGRPEIERSLELTGVRCRFHRYPSMHDALAL
ncbi:STAS domain-containing protein [Nocardia shimofusensis]|uniref:STAS domain-containing protein n=1 Tax=Nocardia shimofusensis TaxID=228596 RepID=UPI00082A0333|nr:STAS domain-containing protein [Nocardia shimofusensis]